MPDSDRRLVERTLGGDRDAFGDLVERYWEPVHGLVLEKTRSVDDADDLAQETFSKAYEELAQLRRPARFGVWLRSIATNMALDWWRQRESRERRHSAPDVVALYQPVLGPDESLELRDAAERLWKAMDRLPPEHRQALVLYYVEGCTERAMASFLGVASPTVHWRLFQARRRLSNELRQALAGSIRRREGHGREAREKITAALPLMACFLPVKRHLLARWGWRALLAAGCAGLAGLQATRSIDLPTWLAADPSPTSPLQSGFRVHLERWELPAMSVLWEPRAPRAGDQVRVTAAGPNLGRDEEPPELHYVTERRYPIDHSVPMQPDMDGWVAQILVPSGARAVFFYVSPEKEGDHDLQGVAYLSTEKLLRRYEHSFVVHADSGVPVPGASQLQAEMARLRGDAPGDVLRLLDNEIRRYPEGFGAHRVRWQVMLESAGHSPDIGARVRAVQEALRTRHGGNPELLWQIAAMRPEDRIPLYKELSERFPGHDRADEALYRLSFQYGMTGDWTQSTAVLEKLLRLG